MWGLIVVHSKQVFHFNCVRYNEVPLYIEKRYYFILKLNSIITLCPFFAHTYNTTTFSLILLCEKTILSLP